MQLIALLPLLASFAEARHLPLRRHRQNQPNKQHHQHVRAMGMDAGYGLDERGLPITATTTVVVDMTSTQTVWVQPTGQVPMQPEPSASVSVSMTNSSSVSTASASDSGSGSSSLPSVSTEATSASPTSPPTESSSAGNITASASSSSEWISSIVSASSSASASDWSSSAISNNSTSASATVSESAPAVSTSLSSWEEPSSSAASASASASSTWSESASEPTPSANATSIAPSSTSGSASDASSFSQSESLTEASYSSSSIYSGSASASAASSAGASPSVSASISASANATASASMSDWAASSSSANVSISASRSASSASASASAPASSSSNATNNSSSSTSASASSASSSSSSSDQSSSSILPSSTSASASAASASPSSGHHTAGVPRTLMAGYYPDWSAWTLPPESVDWSKFDVVDFAFAIPTWDGRLEFTQWDSSELLNRLVTGAHRNGKRVKLSIGGWTGSKYFSSILGDYNQRQNFVKNCVQAYWAYSLDGIDVDWEYPNSGGAQGNIVSSADSANYLLFLQDLRAALPEGALITLATQVWPFAGPNGRPLGDVSGFAKVIDWILIMNYDIWGSSDNPGPNAPLSDECGTSTQPLANAYASVASWTAAGMPVDKITLGVPAYGYLQKSWARQLRTRDYVPPSIEESANLTSSLVPIHKRQNGIVTVRNGGGGDNNGQIGFADLVKQGALALDSSNKFIGAGGFYREWDRCSSTPWLRSSHTGQVITYDDPDSLSMKGQFARQSGLRGVNMFSMDGDWNGSNWPLTDSLRSGMGI